MKCLCTELGVPELMPGLSDLPDPRIHAKWCWRRSYQALFTRTGGLGDLSVDELAPIKIGSQTERKRETDREGEGDGRMGMSSTGDHD